MIRNPGVSDGSAAHSSLLSVTDESRQLLSFNNSTQPPLSECKLEVRHSAYMSRRTPCQQYIKIAIPITDS